MEKSKRFGNYLNMLKEAEKRDHRLLGNINELIHFQEEAPGSVFWHPDGWKIISNFNKLHEKKTK